MIMNHKEITDEQINWLADRIDESHTGILIIKNHLVEKYRKLTGNYLDSNGAIRSKIISVTNGGLGV